MPNPLISLLARNANDNTPGMNILNQFAQFKGQWTPQGAQNKIQEMLQSGKINQQQLEQAEQMACKWAEILK